MTSAGTPRAGAFRRELHHFVRPNEKEAPDQERDFRILQRNSQILEDQQEITTLTVIWARQLVSPQPKLGPVP